MPSVQPRPLRDIVRDLEWRDVKMTKAIAEEAVATIAADGMITKEEVNLIERFGDGPGNPARDRKHEMAGWTGGSETGRALFNALATKIGDLYLTAEVRNELVTAKGEPASIDAMNPFTWWTAGWATSTKGVAVDKGAFLADVRQSAVGWVNNSVSDVLRAYPKATVEVSTRSRAPLPQVQAKIDALHSDWLAGRVPDQQEIAATLRTYLEANFR